MSRRGAALNSWYFYSGNNILSIPKNFLMEIFECTENRGREITKNPAVNSQNAY